MSFKPLQWAQQLFIAVDQLVNVLSTPFQSSAWADETLSSRIYRGHRDGKVLGRLLMPPVDLLFRWQTKQHCYHAYLKEQERMNLPPEFREKT